MDDFCVFRRKKYLLFHTLGCRIEEVHWYKFNFELRKCHFMIKEKIVLGNIISSKGIKVDQSNIERIEKLLPPLNMKGIKTFIGHTRF